MTQPAIRHLSADERRRLALGAASIFERMAFSTPADEASDADSGVPGDHVLSVVRSWIQAFSPGDPAALERRLAWDDLTLAAVADAISATPASVAEPEWLEWVDAIAAASREVADDRTRGPLAERRLFETTAPPPFLDVLVPVVRAARSALDVPLAPHFAAPAVAALDAHLLRRAASFAELSLLEAFHGFVAANRGGYDAFLADMLGGGFVPFLLEYPVLARQLALVASAWAATTAELARRLDSDRPLIAETFAGGADPGVVVGLEPALSDPHDGGRRVAMLTFATGVRVVYKPRAVGLDQAFHAFVAWTGDGGLRPVQRFLRAINRGDYGWVEAVDQEAFETPSEVCDYYRRAGVLLCLTYVLRAKDLHMENVVATRGGPVLIDVELTLQPRPRASTILPAAPAAGDPGVPDHDHCLTSGLLTLVESSGGQVFDIGGLRGTGTGIAVMPGRAWHALETDAIHVTEEKTFAARVGNAVVLDGVVQTPDAFQSELAEGFEAAYRFLMSRRDEILAPEGPLSRFAGQPTRVLARATSQYGTLNFVLARPRYQRDGCRWSAALDALNRGLNQSQDRPDVWPMLVAERQALERLDVPHFTVQTDRTAVCAENHELVAGHFGQSGLEAVAERLRRLSDAHLSAELERLKGALAETIHARFTTEPGDDGDDAADATQRGYLTRHALWIGRELVTRATRTELGLEWDRRGDSEPPLRGYHRHHLYDGSTGPALFLAALAAVTGDPQWSAAARDALGPLRADVARTDPATHALGVAAGLGSIVYALTMTATFLEDATLADLASEVAVRLTPERISADTSLDLAGGSAGAALGLLALHRLSPDPGLLDRAVRCGERLVETSLPFERGAAWRTADGHVFTGLAHGVAGIAYALSRLHDVTGDRRFGRAAADGYAWVGSQFVQGAGNWPILAAAADGVPVQRRMMTAWCHGAPGIALALAAGTADIVEPQLLEALDAALATTAAASTHRADHVCCGNMGRCDALFTAGRRLMRRETCDGAQQLARVVIGRARESGHFRLTANGFEYRIFDHGFFRGVSGIGYALLHLASPNLPSVAAFEAPRERGRLQRPTTNNQRPTTSDQLPTTNYQPDP